MGINPTPFSYKSFTFDGKSTREFGVYITGEGVFNAPERAVEMISIPGRDGEYALDQGHFNNIEVTYRAGIVADSTTDFAEAISNFRNWLASREGYCRLTDEYNAEEYRMAVFKNAIALEHEGLLTGEFDVTFDCKPQRFLTSGEELIDVGVWGDVEQLSGDVVEFYNDDTATALKSAVVTFVPFQDLHGYDAPWVGGAGKNLLDLTNATLTRLTLVNASQGKVKADISSYYYGAITLSGANVPSQITQATLNGTPITLQADNNNGKRISILIYGTRTNGTSYQEATEVASNSVTITPTLFTSVTSIEFRILRESSSYTDTTTEVSGLRLSVGSGIDFEPYENICPISGIGTIKTGINNKNFIEATYTTSTNNGVTFTVNTDGTITTSGTAGNSGAKKDFLFNYNTQRIMVPPGDYYFNGCADGGSETKWKVDIAEWAVSAKPKKWDGVTDIDSDYGTNDDNQIKILDNRTYTYRISIAPNVNADGLTFKPMIRYKTETDGTYEKYNGDIFTTSLGTVKYGGTLDVVSGVLTITHKLFNVTNTMLTNATYVSGASNTSSYYYNLANVIADSDRAPSTFTLDMGAWGDKLEARQGMYSDKTVEGFTVSGRDVSIRINADRVADTSGASLAAYLTSLDIVYPLATPITTTLTAQQIDALIGNNYVWATGSNRYGGYNIDLEYGHNPYKLTNPTPFEARPLLEAVGYGDINIGNETITIENIPIGNTQISKANGLDKITIESDILNAGDTFTVSGASADVFFCGFQGSTLNGVTLSSETNCTTIPFTLSSNYYGRTMFFPDITFAKGTSNSQTSSFVCDVSVIYNGNIVTTSITTTIVMAYDGASTITYTLSGAIPSTAYVSRGKNYHNPDIFSFSTKSALGNPMYIDLDIGEAYNLDSGTAVSVNNAVQLPAELPTLSSGNTSVSYDNTITQLKVQPRWWKI